MRSARLHIPGIVHHLIWRFADRAWCFTDDDERGAYRARLGRALDASDWRCLGYALMPGQVHLALIAGAEPLASWSRRVHTPFARWMNERHRRLGPVFADGPKDYTLAPGSTGPLLAHIHDAPVRAGLVARADDSDWTSHRAYVGTAIAPHWLHVDEGLRLSHEPASPLVVRPFARIRPDPRHIVEIVCAMLDVPAAEIQSRNRAARLVEARRAIVHSGRRVGLTGADLADVLNVTEQAVSKMALHSEPPALCERVVEQFVEKLATR